MAFIVRDFRNKRFFQVDNEYLNGYARLCGINATGVYFSLCRHADREQICFPSKRLIAEELAISERSVYTAIKKLEEWNIIKIENQGRKKDGSFKNLIYILLDKSQWQEKPSANGAVGKKRQEPSANGAVAVGNTCRITIPIEQYPFNKTNIPLPSGKAELKRDDLKYPKEEYNDIIKTYENLKGVKFNGYEYRPIQQTIKSMFMCGRTKYQIIKCMEFFNEHENQIWQNWTIDTIKKQIPLFVAGKL